MITHCLPFAISFSVILTAVMFLVASFLKNKFTEIDILLYLIMSGLVCVLIGVITSDFPEYTTECNVPVTIRKTHKELVYLNMHKIILFCVPITNTIILDVNKTMIIHQHTYNFLEHE